METKNQEEERSEYRANRPYDRIRRNIDAWISGGKVRRSAYTPQAEPQHSSTPSAYQESGTHHVNLLLILASSYSFNKLATSYMSYRLAIQALLCSRSGNIIAQTTVLVAKAKAARRRGETGRALRGFL